MEELRSEFSSEEEMYDFFGAEIDEELFVSPKEYFFAKKEFDDKIVTGEWESMFDLLVFYNLNDCEILHKAMTNFCKTVKIAFDAEPLEKITLPGLAEGKFIKLILNHIISYHLIWVQTES